MQTQRSPRSSTSPTPRSKPLNNSVEERFVPVPTVKMQSKTHRPSLSSTMSWLGRTSSSSSNHSGSYTPSKPIRISEPIGNSAYENLIRSGPLGAGATVVRTPQEALALARDRSPEKIVEVEEDDIEEIDEEDRDECQDDTKRPSSPPLPPIPADDIDDDVTLVMSSPPSCPQRVPPPVPEEEPETPRSTPAASPKRKSSMKMLDQFPPVPALPANVPQSPPQPAFEPILLSAVPSGAIDPSKILVAIETSTQTYKTTLNTIKSRPSFLASYLQSLLPQPDKDEDMRPDSAMSDAESSFHSIFHNHLATSGLLPPSTTTIHIFLDRPSAPYAHILAYLRTPPSTPEHPAALPRAVQLLSASSSRLEALLELRDEARYLDLEELHKLCTDELRARHNLGLTRQSMHTRGISATSISTGSVRSLGLDPLRESLEEYDRLDNKPKITRRQSKDSGLGSSTSTSTYSTPSPTNSIVPEVGWSSTPVSVGLAQRGRTRPAPKKSTSLRGRPVGDWI